MLCRPARDIPAGDGWAFEVKFDGFRALVDTRDGFRVRSRRGWDMTDRLPELASLPTGIVLDGELVGDGGRGNSFPCVCRRLLQADMSVPVTFVAFDVLAVDDTDVTRQPYRERRRLLEGLNLDAERWTTIPTFDDGDALWRVVEELELEGLVAKRRNGTYRPGEQAPG